MEITVSKESGRVPVTVLRLAGNLDGQSYRQLIDAAREQFEAGARSFLLDFKELAYISSAGLVALHTIVMMLRGEELPDPEQGWNALKSMERTRDGGKQTNVKILSPRAEVMSVLDMVGFSSLFEIFTDQAKAVQSY